MLQDSLYLFHTDHKTDILKQIGVEMPASILEKALRFVKIEDRNNFIAARWILYYLASQKLTNLQFGIFEYTKAGKPFLPGYFPFSISHSNSLAAVLISEKEVGIDLEKIVDIKNTEDFSSFFSVSELNQIESSDNRMEMFFYYWTIKEAILKFTGEGISGINKLKQIEFLSDREIIHLGKNLVPDIFKFKDYLITSIRSKEHNCLKPLRVYICSLSDNYEIMIQEIIYLPEKISILKRD
jgi:4'-phosphopantetheinyl transferase